MPSECLFSEVCADLLYEAQLKMKKKMEEKFIKEIVMIYEISDKNYFIL